MKKIIMLLCMAISCAIFAQSSPPPEKNLYMVVDLSGGTSATAYPVSFLPDVPAGGWTDEYKTDKIVFRKIPAGTFTMGSPTTEFGRNDKEIQHDVTLSKSFYMSVFEVTQKQYGLVMGNYPSLFRVPSNRPVEQVSWDMIMTKETGFMAVLSGKVADLNFDLPTEAQWEYACRAGTTTAYNAGDGTVMSFGEYPNRTYLGRFSENNGVSPFQPAIITGLEGIYLGTDTVGSYAPNAWGLYDMHGNVSEWCRDWYGDYQDASINPTGPESGEFRVLRGGGWGDSATSCRSAFRNSAAPSTAQRYHGFRSVAVVLEPEVTWGDLSFTYNGSAQLPTATAGEYTVIDSITYYDALGNEIADPNTIKNAGTYSVKIIATCGSTTKEFIKEFTIAKAPVENLTVQNFELQYVTPGQRFYLALPEFDEITFTGVNGETVTPLTCTFSGLNETDIATELGVLEVTPVFTFTNYEDKILNPVSLAVLSEENNSYDYMIVDLSAGATAERYPVFYLDAEPINGWTDDFKTRYFVMRKLPAGTFMNNSVNPSAGVGAAAEKPQDPDSVMLTKPFYIGVFEVTQKQWELVMGNRPSYFKNDSYYATRPVEQVSWNMIMAKTTGFMAVLGKRIKGANFTLPTEAQWKYACRAGTTTLFNAGNGSSLLGSENGLEQDLGRYWENGGSEYSENGGTDVGTAKVGTYVPNTWGLYDMHGNVWEWTASVVVFGNDSLGGLRGGGFNGVTEEYCSSESWIRFIVDGNSSSYGFRPIAFIAESGVEWAEPLTFTYNGSTYIPVTDVIGMTLSDYTYYDADGTEIDAPVNAGTYSVKITATTGLITKEFIKEFTIAKAPVENLTVQNFELQYVTPGQRFYSALPEFDEITFTGVNGETVTPLTCTFSGLNEMDIATELGVLEVAPVFTFANYEDVTLDAMQLAVLSEENNASYKYIVYDLSGGTSATSYPMLFLDEAPTSGWGDDFKTKYLVMRKIPDQNYSMGVFEVTQKQWELVMGTNPSNFKSESDSAKRPVEQVSWNMIKDGDSSFMAKLNGKVENVGFDLPSGEQWRSAYVSDVDSLENNLTYGRCYEEGTDGTAVAGSYLPNTLGLYDMLGNVWEWTTDESSSSRVLRGGSWLDFAWDCSAELGYNLPPNDAWDSCGFRLVAVPDPKLYMVVDLSGGTSATLYPVTYLDSVPTGGWTDEHKTDKIVLRKISAGTFTMGSSEEEGGYSDERPQHSVTLTKPFYMGVFEVTQKQYELVMGNKPSNFTGDTLPVEQVSWDTIKNESSGFMTALSDKVADLNFDLPTEAQWEYACRAGTTGSYNVDGKELSDLGWVGENSSSSTHAVGGKLPNAWGLYDMHGNVFEWCLDWFGNYEDGSVTDPTGPGSGYSRVFRGGCWYFGAGYCRSAYRNLDDSSYAFDFIGFRLAAVPDPKLYMVVDLSGGTSATSYPVTYLDGVPTGGWADEHKTDKIVFRKILAGTFTMGSGERNETLHDVTLTKPFYMGVFEVTQKQYELVMGTKPSNFTGDTLPVEQVSWNTIKDGERGFMTVLGRKVSDLDFDLPTEAQWEYACRAGTTGSYNVDGKELSDLGWFGENSSSSTHAVGGKLPNAWGLYDMHGNVWEWCSDWYLGNHSTGAAVTDPTGAMSGNYRVLRGGGGDAVAGSCRSAYRGYYKPSLGDSYFGFRLTAVFDPQRYMVVDLSGGTSAMSYPVTYLDSVPAGGWTDEHKTDKIVFRKIPAGTFTMGSSEKEGGYSDERLQHEVIFSKSFYMGVFEVTQKQYELVMGNKPSNFTGDTLPVEQVSWDTIKNESSGFMTALSDKVADLNFDLPTEAQWEYACRAGTTGSYNVDGKELSDLGWFSGNSESKTHTVGGKLSNAWGLYDMHGNVWEWCLDWYGSYSDGAVTDPMGPGSGDTRVIRGGSWHGGVRNCRSACRSSDYSSYADDSFGFRAVAFLSQDFLSDAERFIFDKIPASLQVDDFNSVSVAVITKVDKRLEKAQAVETAYTLGLIPEFAEAINADGILDSILKYEFGLTKMTPVSGSVVDFEAQIIVTTGSIVESAVGTIRLFGSENGVDWDVLAVAPTTSEIAGKKLTVTFTEVEIGIKTKFKVVCSK